MTRRTLPLLAAVVAAATLVAGCSSEQAAPSTTAAATTSTTAVCAPPDTGTVTAEQLTVPPGSTQSEWVVTSFDGTKIRAHWFPLPGATADNAAPTVLMGPGWGLAGDTDPEGLGILGAMSIGGLQKAGYNVLTWDPRGFGKSGGVATVNDKDLEGKDVQRLISFVAKQPGVQLDSPGDPRLGMVGASYGGGIQLVTAAIDCRVEAIVPVIAWHSLETSLYKAKVPKSGWATILAGVSELGKIDPRILSAKKSGDATSTVSDEDFEWFQSRGPGELVNDVKVPTLIVQGTVDTLFTLAEGVQNYEIINDNGVPVAMVWYCGGHGFCNAKEGDPDRVSTDIVNWLDRYVKDDSSAPKVPGFDMVDQDGVRYTAPKWPLTAGEPITASGSGALELTKDSRSEGPVSAATAGDTVGRLSEQIMPGVAKVAVDVTIPFGDRSALVVGAPKLQLTYSGTAPDGPQPEAVFAQLVDTSNQKVVGQQITPVALELDGKEHSVKVDLEMIAFAAQAGQSMTLQLVATTSAYATPRLGGSVNFSKIRISLPTVTSAKPVA
jgi:ABC-2 type transport system ATP-binding protein